MQRKSIQAGYGIVKMTDLYRIYRALKQRASRAESGTTARDYAEETVEAMAIILDEPTEDNCTALIEAEKRFLRLSKTTVNYGDQVLDAITSGDYEIKRPYYNRVNIDAESPQIGFIYIAQTDHKPNQIKIGYTTTSIETRFRQYKHRYGYKLDLYFSEQVKFPAAIECGVAAELRKLRVSGMIHGDSIEWYKTSPEEALKVLKKWLFLVV